MYDYDRASLNDSLGESTFSLDGLLTNSTMVATDRPLWKCTSGLISFEVKFMADGDVSGETALEKALRTPPRPSQPQPQPQPPARRRRPGMIVISSQLA